MLGATLSEAMFACVVLSWAAVPEPLESDVVAVFASSVSAVPIGVFFVNQSATWAQGKGAITMASVVNMRSQYVFRYQREVSPRGSRCSSAGFSLNVLSPRLEAHIRS